MYVSTSSQELRSQSKLSELYKASSEEAQAQVEELKRSREELHSLLRDASVRYSQLESNSRAEIYQLKQEIEEKVASMDETRKELDRANSLLEAAKSRVLSEECIEAMSPSAAAASRYEVSYF